MYAPRHTGGGAHSGGPTERDEVRPGSHATIPLWEKVWKRQRALPPLLRAGRRSTSGSRSTASRSTVGGPSSAGGLAGVRGVVVPIAVPVAVAVVGVGRVDLAGISGRGRRRNRRHGGAPNQPPRPCR